MKNKVLIICPYFGKEPPFFNLWALSAGFNSSFSFLILGDFEVTNPLPENIKMIKTKFSDIQERIKSIFGENVKIERPYKLCDYRPAYGRIFSDYCYGFDFWGYCDFDLIFGNMSAFINDDLLDRIDKCYRHGHFTLYRNNSEINAIYRKKIPHYATYMDAFSTNYSCHFDESSFLANDNCTGLRTFFSWDFYDIPAFHSNFIRHSSESVYTSVVEWKNGELSLLYEEKGRIVRKPILYAHFQKRMMSVETTDYKNGFLAVPNVFRDIETVDIAFMKDASLPSQHNQLDFLYRRISDKVKNIFVGGLKWRLHRFKVDEFLK